MLKQFIRDFSPWILFSILIEFKVFTIPISALVCLAALFIVARKHLWKKFILDWGAVVFFAYLSMGPSMPLYNQIEAHINLASNVALMVIVGVSILVRVPFTIQYAKEQTLKPFHKTPFFRRVNDILSLVWFGVFAALSGCSILKDFYWPGNVWLSSFLPILFLGLGVVITQWFPEYYKTKKLQIPNVPNTNIKHPMQLSLKDGRTMVCRPATAKDISRIAPLIQLASGGIEEFLLHDLDSETSLQDFVKDAMSNKIGEMSYRHSTVCEVDGNVVGLLHCFPLSFHKPPKVTMVPKERFEYLKPFYDVHIPNSLYLFTLAVIGEFQGQGIGAQLISIAKLRAQEHGFTSLSLHAWADNQKALELYKKSGFKVVKQCAIPRHPLLPHDNGMVLMQWAPDPSSNI